MKWNIEKERALWKINEGVCEFALCLDMDDKEGWEFIQKIRKELIKLIEVFCRDMKESNTKGKLETEFHSV